MQISYQLTTDDYRQAIQTFRKHNRRSRWNVRGYYFSFFLCLCVAVTATVVDPHEPGLPVILCMVSIVLAYCLWYAPYETARKLMRGNVSAQESHLLELTDGGLQSQSESSSAHMDWKMFCGWAENEKVFIILYAAYSFIPVPKRAMTEAQQQEFRALLQNHVTERMKS